MAIPIIGIITGALLLPQIIANLANFYPPFAAKLARRAYRDNPDLIPTVDQLVQLTIKGDIDESSYINNMMQAGYNADVSGRILHGARTLLTAFDYVTLMRRGEMTEDETNQALSHLGIDDATIDHVKAVTLYYPNPDDIVRFAVREVYNDAIVSGYRLDDDITPEYITAASKAGLSEEFARQYWRAHWQLPSPTQVYEMLHRRVISKEDMVTYLRTADYSPVWRDKLIEISYNPLTRIDIRRMHKAGKLSDEQVYNCYLDLGYSPDNAALLRDFTIDLSRPKPIQANDIPEITSKTATRADIIKAYKMGYHERPNASSLLLGLGYDSNTVALMLDLVDAEVEEERIDLAADSYVDMYVRGDIDINQLQVELTSIGVPNSRINLIIARELSQAAKRIKRASKTDLDRWAMYGLIDPDTYRKRLSTMGYTSEDIDLYIKEISYDLTKQASRKLSPAKYLTLYVKGLVTLDEIIDILHDYGYSDEDIRDLVDEANLKRKV